MATKKQFQDHIIDEIIDAIYSFRDENYFSDPDSAHYIPDLSNLYRKTIGDSGQIETGENLDNEQIVIYQEDYQHSLNSQSMNSFIDVIVSCWDHQAPDNFPEEASLGGTWSFNNGTYVQGAADDGLASLNLTFVCAKTETEMTQTLTLNTDTLNYLSQLVTFKPSTTQIDAELAQDILDTNIYELLPSGLTRQERINKFFAEFEELVGEIPEYDFDLNPEVGDGNDTWEFDVEGNQNTYSSENDISDPLLSSSGNITRLIRHENEKNENKSLKIRCFLIN